MAQTLTDDEIDERLRGGQWRRDGQAITRELSFENFAQAVEFVNRVAQAAEAVNHHPDITIHGYNKVRLSLSTHSAGGVTAADLDMAQQLDGVV